MGMIAKLRRIPAPTLTELTRATEEEFEAFQDDDQAAGLLDLHKYWDAIHVALTDGHEAVAPPLDFLLHGGSELSDTDCGYGPTRTFEPKAVERIASAFEALPATVVERRLDLDRLRADGVYPSIWEDADALTDVRDHLECLRSFVGEAAANGEALVVWLS